MLSQGKTSQKTHSSIHSSWYLSADRCTANGSLQLVEDEDLIGALIETNDRINSGLEAYEALSDTKPEGAPDGTGEITHGLSATRISEPKDDTQEVEDESEQNASAYPDLQDLSFGPLGASSSKLPAPIKPSQPSQLSGDYRLPRRGSLSDFSDYISSDEETRDARADSSRRNYIDVSENSEDDTRYVRKELRAPLASASDGDPFADPFADETAVSSR